MPKKPTRQQKGLALAEEMREYVQRKLSPDIRILPWAQAAEITRRPFRIVARWLLKQIRLTTKTKTVLLGDPKDRAKVRALHEELSKVRPLAATADALRDLLARSLPYVVAGKKGKARKKLEAEIRAALPVAKKEPTR